MGHERGIRRVLTATWGIRTWIFSGKVSGEDASGLRGLVLRFGGFGLGGGGFVVIEGDGFSTRDCSGCFEDASL